MPDESRMAAVIHAEHETTLGLLNRLEAAVAKGGRGPRIDPNAEAGRALLDAVRRVCANDAERHFGFEESRLFPHILAQGGACMVNILTAEHAQIRPIAAELRGLADAAIAAGGFDDAAWKRFVFYAKALIDVETFHIQKEEMGLIGALHTMFDAEADAALAAEYAAIAAPE